MTSNIPPGYNPDGEFIGFPARGSGPHNWWARIPASERAQRMSDLASHRQAQLTPEQKSENAKRAVTARWAKKKLSTG